MIKTRYEFFKRTHKDHVIIFLTKGKYVLYGKDKKLLDLFGKGNIVAFLEKLKVDYIIVDGLEIIKRKVFLDNRYKSIEKKYFIMELLRMHKKY